MIHCKLLSPSAFLVLSALATFSAEAQEIQASKQDPPADELQDIVVTAQRQTSSVQRTPLSIAAVGGEDLANRGVANLDSLTSTIPNVNFSRLAADARIFIRGIGLEGIGAGSDGRVAIYTEDVVNARPQAALTSLFDLNRVEVLRGPQGTLYGRNATAGAVNLISNDPTKTLSGYASITAGNYNLIRAEGAISGPLSESVSARLAFQTNDRDGYGKNITTGNQVDSERSRAVRAKVAFAPNDKFRMMITGDYRRENDNAGGYAFVRDNPSFPDVDVVSGFAHPANPQDRAGLDQLFFVETYGLTANAVLEIADRVEITSITGYRHLDQSDRGNVDDSTSMGTSLDLANRAEQVSQELRLSLNRGPLALVAGGYFFHERNSFTLNQAVSALYFGGAQFPLYQGFGQGGTQKTDAYAAFAQGTVSLTDKLGMDIGVRYSYEKRGIGQYNQLDFVDTYKLNAPLSVGCPAPPVTGFIPGVTQCNQTESQSASWSSFDPRGAVHYQFTDSILGYVSYSQGFKSGGFDLGALKPAYNPEKLKDYEAGIKADLLNRTLRVNVGGFYYDYDNLQITVLKLAPTPGPVTLNAAKARLYGAEVEITALPIDDLRVGLNGAWLHSQYLQLSDTSQLTGQLVNLAGNQLTSAPKYKVVGELGYTLHPGFADMTPRAELTWTSPIQFSQFNYEFQSQPAWWELNLYLDLVRKDNWTVSAYGRNVTNHTYYVSEVLSAPFFGSPVVGIPGPPATYGLSVTKRF